MCLSKGTNPRSPGVVNIYQRPRIPPICLVLDATPLLLHFWVTNPSLRTDLIAKIAWNEGLVVSHSCVEIKYTTFHYANIKASLFGINISIRHKHRHTSVLLHNAPRDALQAILAPSADAILHLNNRHRSLCLSEVHVQSENTCRSSTHKASCSINSKYINPTYATGDSRK